MRERLAQHRAKGSTCNGCHQYIDPIGFGLEHFDAVGRWRDTDNGVAIDATGNVPGSATPPFDGAVGLATAVGDDPRFLDCMIQQAHDLRARADAGDDAVVGIADGRHRRPGRHPRAARLDRRRASIALIELVASSPAMTMRLGEESP